MANRSKCEIKLKKALRKQDKQLKIVTNDRKLCGGCEVDILLPEHKIAIEWNGILHREPLYGFDKLAAVKKNDEKKEKKLIELGWTFIIVNDIDSKKPLQYAKDVADFVIDMIKKEKNEPGDVYEIEVSFG